MTDIYEGSSQGVIMVNGRILAEVTKISVKVMSNDQLVKTLRKGAAGFSDGANEASGSIESAIPRKGLEKDFVQAVEGKENLKLVILNGGRRRQYWARFTDASWDVGIDATTLISANWVGASLGSLGG